jgi:ATP-binding cassette subfamily C (CFTR/MRP) protein 1
MEETPNINSNNKIIFDTKINNELNKSKNDINEKYEIPPDNIGFDYDLYENSSFFSKLFFLWGYKILKIAKKYKLEIKHLGKINEKNNCKNYFKEIENFWEEKNYKNIKKNALLLTFLRVNLLKIILIFFLSSFNAISEYVQILLIKGYIDYFDSKKPFLGISNIKYLGISFIILQLSSIYINLHNMMIEEIIGLKSNYQLNILIYQKILKNSPSGFIKKAKQGQIINFIDNDSHKLSDLIKYIPGIIINPIKIIAYVYLLFDFFGLSFLFGLIVFIIMIGINIIIFNKYNILEKEFMKRKDERMKLTTETFENIKIIKLYNWESKFEEKILKKRDKEIEVGKKGLKVVIINITLFWFTPILVSITTIGFYQYFNDKISISIILVGLAIFERLQNPIINLPEIITNFIDTIISMRRIEKYLKENDIENNIIKKCKNNNNAIEIENAYFTWGIEQNKKKTKNKNNEIINDNNDNDSNSDESDESSEENSLNSSFNESDNENKINIKDSEIKENEINNSFLSINNSLDNKIEITSKRKFECVLKNIILILKKEN